MGFTSRSPMRFSGGAEFYMTKAHSVGGRLIPPEQRQLPPPTPLQSLSSPGRVIGVRSSAVLTERQSIREGINEGIYNVFLILS